MKRIIIITICFWSIVFNNNAGAYETINLYTPNGNIFTADLRNEDSIGMLEYYMDIYYLPFKDDNVILLSCASDRYNCHGFAWVISEGGPVCSLEWDVYIVMAEGSYEETTEEFAEKIYYVQGHSAVKSQIYEGMYVSKWSSGPLVVHYPNVGPWPQESTDRYYRLKCPSEIKNKTYTTGEAATIRTRCDVLEISNTEIEAGASVTVISNSKIRLLPGFRAQAGSTFCAKIEPFDFDVDNPVLSIPIESGPCEEYLPPGSP